VGIKTPQFSYQRLKGANPVAHVEMASTGEVACLGANLLEAFFTSWFATEQKINGKRLLISIGGDKKEKLIEELRILEKRGWELFSTPGTYDFLLKKGILSTCLFKASEKGKPNVLDLIYEKRIDLIINIPKNAAVNTLTDGYKIRRLAIDRNIALITNLQLAICFLQSLIDHYPPRFPIKSLDEFVYA
jgi:carbamoyl-phosphate synthase large subunit